MNQDTSLPNRIFKLSNGEQINADEFENLIEKTCHYVKYAVVGQNETDQTIALIFPNDKLLSNPDYLLSPNEGCFCPRNIDELGRCLTGCLKLVNQDMKSESGKILEALIINKKEMPLENDSKNSFPQIIEKYKSLLHQTHGNDVPVEEEIYYIKNI